jgi:hypothetical protein
MVIGMSGIKVINYIKFSIPNSISIPFPYKAEIIKVPKIPYVKV